MKKLMFLTPFIFSAAILLAQPARSDLYNVDRTGNAKSVYTLGENPQFPFLRGLSTPQQVANAMHSSENRRKYPQQMKELDKIMMGLGFENGAMDVQASDISAHAIEPGASGNMGSGNNKYSYSVLKTKKPQKAWMVAGNDGEQAIALMNACGNAFYSADYTGYKPCNNEVVNVSSEPKEITVSAPQKIQKKVYVYYRRGCACSDCTPSWSRAAYEDGILSRPLLVKTVKAPIPQSYTISTNGSGNALICKGKTTEVTTGLVVEKEDSYTGYMPPAKQYVQVPRREYKRLLKQKQIMHDVLARPAHPECKTCK